MNKNQKNFSDVRPDYSIKYDVSSLVVSIVGLICGKFSLEFVSLGFLGLFGGCCSLDGSLTAEQVQGAKI